MSGGLVVGTWYFGKDEDEFGRAGESCRYERAKLSVASAMLIWEDISQPRKYVIWILLSSLHCALCSALKFSSRYCAVHSTINTPTVFASPALMIEAVDYGLEIKAENREPGYNATSSVIVYNALLNRLSSLTETRPLSRR